jgi:hypothetical protein
MPNRCLLAVTQYCFRTCSSKGKATVPVHAPRSTIQQNSFTLKRKVLPQCIWTPDGLLITTLHTDWRCTSKKVQFRTEKVRGFLAFRLWRASKPSELALQFSPSDRGEDPQENWEFHAAHFRDFRTYVRIKLWNCLNLLYVTDKSFVSPLGRRLTKMYATTLGSPDKTYVHLDGIRKVTNSALRNIHIRLNEGKNYDDKFVFGLPYPATSQSGHVYGRCTASCYCNTNAHTLVYTGGTQATHTLTSFIKPLEPNNVSLLSTTHLGLFSLWGFLRRNRSPGDPAP